MGLQECSVIGSVHGKLSSDQSRLVGMLSDIAPDSSTEKMSDGVLADFIMLQASASGIFVPAKRRNSILFIFSTPVLLTSFMLMLTGIMRRFCSRYRLARTMLVRYIHISDGKKPVFEFLV